MKRTRLATGIYLLPQYGTYAVVWKDRGRQVEKHFAADTPRAALTAYRKRQIKNATDGKKAAGPRGSFPRDMVRYLRTRKGRPSYKSDRSHAKPWIALFGHVSRHAITHEKIALAVAGWADKSPAEIRHRLKVLRGMFRLLDLGGRKGVTPCDHVVLPALVKRRPAGVPDDIITAVALKLTAQERLGWLRDSKTRARFLVLATCGKRPCQLKRARPIDLNFTTRIWDVEPAKNSHGGPLYLNDEMLAAWRLFDQADAWGDFDSPSFAKTLRRNGWPVGVRPYRMRHQTLQTMSNKGVDFGDVQQAAGHASPETTRASYVPHELARSKVASSAIDGRFNPAMFEMVVVDGSAVPAEPPRGESLPSATSSLPSRTTIPLAKTKLDTGGIISNFAQRPRLVKRGSRGPESRKLA